MITRNGLRPSYAAAGDRNPAVANAAAGRVSAISFLVITSKKLQDLLSVSVLSVHCLINAFLNASKIVLYIYIYCFIINMFLPVRLTIVSVSSSCTYACCDGIENEETETTSHGSSKWTPSSSVVSRQQCSMAIERLFDRYVGVHL